MDRYIVFDNKLTKSDLLVLRNLTEDLKESLLKDGNPTTKSADDKSDSPRPHTNGLSLNDETSSNAGQLRDDDCLAALKAFNDIDDANFEPTVFTNFDMDQLCKLPRILRDNVLNPYLKAARSIVRVETDVVMLTHLLLYFTTSVPSALYLFWSFSYVHAVFHVIMQFSYIGSYTLMMHQHIHMRGILNKRFAFIDHLFPYITDPLMGHTWNSYFYHHVKHHHVEGNGPDDLSSTIRYQRDSLFHFLQYTGRFFFFIWFELPLYFLRRGRRVMAVKAGGWEMANYIFLFSAWRLGPKPTTFVFLLPFFLLRLGLMVGNWGQHAFVDEDEPDSDYRSSITLIDVPSNRHCFNDGYHTSHHLNPLRHWREHPASFIKAKHLYASQHALVFHNIDYLMITVRLFMKDYEHLARCLVPIGDQVYLSMEERVTLLKRHTRRFTEEEIRRKFKQA